MRKPLVTIIIPVYNSELYLKKCIDNILKQTYDNLQIIFVNDGSTDASYELCKQVSDSRVEVYSKENGGASSARNFGLKYRKGKYILFVDSDDYLREDAIELLVEKAEDTNADCVYYEAKNYTSDVSIKVKENGLGQKVQYPDSSGSELIKALLENKNYHAVPFLYFTNSSLYDRCLKFEEGIMFEDELFSFELLRMCDKVVCFKEKLYFRNVRPNSVMTSSGKEKFRFHSISVVFEKLYEQFQIKGKDDVLNRYISRIAMLWLGYCEQLTRNDKKEVQQRYRKIRKQILDNKGFGSKELVVRCYGKCLWMIYITPNRLIKKLRRV